MGQLQPGGFKPMGQLLQPGGFEPHGSAAFNLYSPPPRSLNEPVACSHSCLMKMFMPVMALSDLLFVHRGVGGTS
jgi:hypothetical protein